MKRDYNDFSRITRSQTAVARSSRPLKRLKTKLSALSLPPPVGYCGFDVLPNELVEMIVERVPHDLDTVTVMVCKRWKHAISRRTYDRGTQFSRSPYRVLEWAIPNNNRGLIEWTLANMSIEIRPDTHSDMADVCLRNGNIRLLTCFFKAAAIKPPLAEYRICEVCKRGDLTFLKAVLKLYNKDPQAVLSSKCLQACCSAGALETAHWILELGGSGVTKPVTYNCVAWCAEIAFEAGHLPILKWLYGLLADNLRNVWVIAIKHRVSIRQCTPEIEGWVSGLKAHIHVGYKY